MAGDRVTWKRKRGGMRVEVVNTSDRRIVTDVRRLARRVTAVFGPGPVLVSVVFIDDRRMRELNRRYRKLNRATDVLAFPVRLREPGRPATLLGEVFVSRERARAQAREYGVGYHDEVQRLVLHGILHLLGLGHKEMERAYGRILGPGPASRQD